MDGGTMQNLEMLSHLKTVNDSYPHHSQIVEKDATFSLDVCEHLHWIVLCCQAAQKDI